MTSLCLLAGELLRKYRELGLTPRTRTPYLIINSSA
jgi:hypothetical protein